MMWRSWHTSVPVPRYPSKNDERLPLGTVCYLCAKEIAPDSAWDRDHVPPRQIFPKAVRRRVGPQLKWLHTHVCSLAQGRTDRADHSSTI